MDEDGPLHATKARGPKAHLQTVVGVKVGGGVPVWIQGSNSETAIQEKHTAKAPSDVKATTRETCDVLGGASSSFASPAPLLLELLTIPNPFNPFNQPTGVREWLHWRQRTGATNVSNWPDGANQPRSAK
jgi:hypothetical protein